jgi:4a-hydroxytetrahydrobiopterin dehydratase
MNEKTDIANYWQQGDDALTLSLQFKDFSQACAFMTEVALLAESQQHHPEWFNVYSKVEIRLTTHDCNGLSARDYQLAAAIDLLIARYQPVIAAAASPP